MDELLAFRVKYKKIKRYEKRPENTDRPYFDERGALIIPFGSDPRYHWWKGGQSDIETLREQGASQEVIKKYLH